MKLELKHLAPYLPYGLKCELLNYKCDYIGEKYGTINGFYYLGGEVHYTFKDRSTAGKTRNLIKPILRPLSDLTKGYLMSISYGTFINVRNDLEKGQVKYKNMVFLLEKHFDVFGLIEKGLAIDKNKL